MRAGYWKTGLTDTQIFWKHMKCLELAHEHHTACSADHDMCQQDSGWAAWFPFLPHCPLPSLWAQLSSLQQRSSLDSAFCLQKRDTKNGIQRVTSICTCCYHSFCKTEAAHVLSKAQQMNITDRLGQPKGPWSPIPCPRQQVPANTWWVRKNGASIL